MGIEIIHDQTNLLTIRILNLEEVANLVCPVKLGPMFLRVHMPPAGQSFCKQKDAAGTVANVFVIHSLGLAAFHGDSLP